MGFLVRRGATLAAAAVALACGGGGGGTTGPNNNAVKVRATESLTFTPGQVTVSRGKSVTWDFGSVTHNVTFERPTAAADVGAAAADDYPGYPGGGSGGGGTGGDAPDDIPNSTNQSVSRTFGTSGTFHYHCTNHPTMTGTVTVQ